MAVLQKFGFIYILTNHTKTTLYVGVTNNIFRRIQEHKAGKGSVFTSKYNLKYLVYYQSFDDIHDAILKEKKIKNRSRKHKEALINSINPDWNDLADGWEDQEWSLEILIN